MSVEAPARSAGAWRAIGLGWRIFVPVILGDAAIQTLLVSADPVPAFDAGFVALTLGSLVTVVVAVWLTTAAAWAAVTGDARRVALPPAVPAWVLVGVVLGVALALLQPLAVPVVLVLMGLVLPAAAAGAPALAGFRAIRRAPVRHLVAALSTLVIGTLSWAVALLPAFFLTGVLSVVATWLWFGAASTALLCLWSAAFRAGGRPR